MEERPSKQIFYKCSIGTMYNYCENPTTKNEDNLFEPIFFNVQENNPYPSFTGRTLYLEQLNESVTNNRTSAICGFGGIGKTELIRYYVWQNQKKFNRNIVWINAETHESMNSLFKKLALELKVSVMQEGIDRLMDAIIRDIYYKLNRKKCLVLVIFDNAINQDSIADFLPRSAETNIKMIITSQNREWDLTNIIDLDVLSPEESHQFFIKNLEIQEDDLGNVERLAKELQNLPVSLQQAASYIKHRSVKLHENFGILQYIEEFEKKRLFELPLRLNKSERQHVYDKTVYKTVSLTVDLIRETSEHPELTLDILHVCSYLAPDNIPKSIFSQLNANTDVLNEAIHVLIKYSLLREYENVTWFYNIHRLVQLSYRYLNNIKGFDKTTIRKSLFLTTNEEMRRSPHSYSVLCYVMKDPQIDYEFYFDECPNRGILIFHMGFYDYFDGIKYFSEIEKVDCISMRLGVAGAIEKGSFRIVKYICDLHPKLFEFKTEYLGGSAAFGRINIMRYFIKNGADVNQLVNDKYPIINLAIQGNMKETVKFLIKEGSLINLQNMEMLAPMIVAVRRENLDILKILFKNGGCVNTKNSDNKYLLHFAAQKGNLLIIQYLIEKGAQINSVDKSNLTPLHVAADRGHLQIVKYLIEKGEDFNILDVNGLSALFFAAFGGHLPVLQHLHSQGSDINICGTDEAKSTPLMVASANGHIDIVEYLLKNNCDKTIKGHSPILYASLNGHLSIVELLHKNGFEIKVLTKEKVSSVIAAAQNGHLDIVKFLHKNGADINQSTTELYNTPLFSAAENNHEEVVRFLVENGADVNFLTQDGWSALLTSCFDGHLKIVKYLLDNKHRNVDHVNNKGSSALILAAQNGHIVVVKQLIKAKCDIYKTNKMGFNALHVAAQHGHLQIVEFLYETGLDLEDKSLDGTQAIHLAATNGHSAIVEFLLEKGVDIDTVDNDNCTPIFVAAENGCKETVEFLIENGCDIFCADSDGLTPFHVAAINGHLKILQTLNECRYDVNIQDKRGSTALKLAVIYNQPQLVKYLIELGANVNLCDFDGDSSLHESVYENNINLVKYLISKGGDPNLLNSDNSSPIYLAAKNGFLQIVEYLLVVGVDMNIPNKKKYTPLHAAVLNNHVEIVGKLVQHGADLNKFASSIVFEAVSENNIDALNILHRLGVDLNYIDTNGSGLHQAAKYGHLDCIEWFLVYGTDVNILDKNNNSPLHCAVANNHTSAIQLLILCNADYNIVNLNGIAPINMVKSIEATEVLLASIALINSVSQCVERCHLPWKSETNFSFQ